MTGDSLPVLYRDTVRREWIDANGHLNVGYFMVVFDLATDAFLAACGLSTDYKAAHNTSTFAVESHATYQRELREGEVFCCTTQLLDFTDKKVHYFHRMYHESEGYLAATNELLSLYMDMTARRPATFPQTILDRLEVMKSEQAHLPRPVEAGRVIGVHARRPGAD